MATLKEKVLNLVSKIKEVWAENGELKAENADLKHKLAIALSDDVADDDAIYEAQAAASMAKIALAEYRLKVDAIVVEHEELIAVLDDAAVETTVEASGGVTPHPDLSEAPNPALIAETETPVESTEIVVE